MPRIAPRRGLVAKMHRCLSYNMLAMHLEREGERERERRIHLPLPTRRLESISLGRRKKNLHLSLSSKNLRGRTSVASLKRRSNLYRIGIFCSHFSPPKAEQNHARLPPRTYPLGWRVTLEREREREGGRMLVGSTGWGRDGSPRPIGNCP